jgi:hypothetical protein
MYMYRQMYPIYRGIERFVKMEVASTGTARDKWILPYPYKGKFSCSTNWLAPPP